MSSDKPIPISTNSSFVAPTPQNTPLVPAPLGGGLSKPTVPDITEELEDIDIDDDDDDDEAKTAAIQSTMLGMVQGRLAELIGKTSGYIESLPLPVRKRIEGLKGVQTEYSKLETAYKKEVLELEKKYLSLYNPLFDRRQQIIAGEAEPTEAEIKAGEEQSRKDDPEAEPLSQLAKSEDAKKDQDVKGIPDFWLTALRNHLAISEMITERDEEAIRALKDIRM
jgi:nucleosome assembly protein 1-like 1